MTYTAIKFALTSTEDGRQMGAAVLCLEASYASVLWAGVERLDRLHVTPADWKAIQVEIARGLSPGPVPTDGPLYMILAGERAGYAVVQWIAGVPLRVERPEQAAEALDRLLRHESTS